MMKKIFFFFYLTLTVVTLSEIILWSLFPLSKADTHIYSQSLPGLKKKVGPYTNKFGYRSLSMSNEKKGNRTIRIVCLGASTTELPTQNIEDAWPGILDQRFRRLFEKSAIKIEIVSLAVGGWKIWNGYKMFQAQAAMWDPDIVINLWGINDLVWNGGPEYAYEGKVARVKKIEEDLRPRESSVKDLLVKYSQICKRLWEIKKSIVFKKKKVSGSAFEWHSSNLPRLRARYRRLPYKEELVREPDPIVEFRDGLEQLLSLLKRKKIETIVMSQPVLWKSRMTEDEVNALWFSISSKDGPLRMSGVWLEDEMNKYNSVQKDLAQKLDATFIPLDSFIPKNLNYIFDDCHFTDEGNVLVASTIYPFILSAIEKVITEKGLKN